MNKYVHGRLPLASAEADGHAVTRAITILVLAKPRRLEAYDLCYYRTCQIILFWLNVEFHRNSSSATTELTIREKCVNFAKGSKINIRDQL